MMKNPSTSYLRPELQLTPKVVIILHGAGRCVDLQILRYTGGSLRETEMITSNIEQFTSKGSQIPPNVFVAEGSPDCEKVETMSNNNLWTVF